MKKLLSTTAILGALAFSATSAEAANLQVNVGGFLDFQAGYVDDEIIDATDANELNFNTDTEIHFTVEGKADNGLEYGAVIELEADVNAGDTEQNGGVNADKAYAFLQGGWGRAEMGNNTDASEALSVNSATFASATGGIDGDFYRYLPAGTDTTFLIRPDLPIANNNVANEDATRLTYYTPRFAGFQAGVSYTPNSEATGVTLPAVAGFENVFSGGVNYSADFNSVGVKAAINGQTGDGEATGADDLEAWDAGLNLTFAGFTVGGSYGDIEEAGVAGVESDYWDAGVGYAAGPFSASVTYFDSETDFGAGAENEFNNISVGADYQLAPGLVPYAEVNFFDGDADVGLDNDGTVVIVGSELTF